MKRSAAFVMTMCLIFAFCLPASAQFFMSHFSDAQALSADGVEASAGFSAFEGMLGLGGIIKFGIIDGLEMGARLGFINYDHVDHTGLTFGGEIKYQFLDTRFGDPVDLAFGGGIEYYDTGEKSSLWMFGGNSIVSYPIKFQSGQSLAPLFRLNFSFNRYGAGDMSDTKFKISFGLGADFKINKNLGFYGEVIFSGDDFIDNGFVGGVRFGL